MWQIATGAVGERGAKRLPLAVMFPRVVLLFVLWNARDRRNHLILIPHPLIPYDYVGQSWESSLG